MRVRYVSRAVEMRSKKPKLLVFFTKNLKT